MKTETIEWFTPEEKLPEDGKDVVAITDIGLEIGYYDAGYMDWFCPIIGTKVLFWAYIPKGPQ